MPLHLRGRAITARPVFLRPVRHSQISMKTASGLSFLTPPSPFVRFAIQVKTRRGRHARLMNKKDLLFAAIALSVIGLFIFLSINRRHPPDLTTRPEHAGVTRPSSDNRDDILKHNESCLVCHSTSSQIAPMLESHPKKGRQDQTTPCAVCHELPRQQTALLHSIINSKGVFSWSNRQQK